MIEKVSVFIFKRTMRGYEFLILKRPESHGNIWQPITGHIEKGEKPLEAAKREVKEETGIDNISRIVDPEVSYEFTSDNKKNYKEYLFGFEVPQTIEEITISDEHVNYSWLNAETSRQMIHWQNNKEGLDKLIEKGGL
jgi:8-oxo-dGTP pyrophosphatase MutT (NUDIX family)